MIIGCSLYTCNFLLSIAILSLSGNLTTVPLQYLVNKCYRRPLRETDGTFPGHQVMALSYRFLIDKWKNKQLCSHPTIRSPIANQQTISTHLTKETVPMANNMNQFVLALPTLTATNYPIWKFSIFQFAAESQIHQHLCLEHRPRYTHVNAHRQHVLWHPQ